MLFMPCCAGLFIYGYCIYYYFFRSDMCVLVRLNARYCLALTCHPLAPSASALSVCICTVIERLLSMCNSHTHIKDVQRYDLGLGSGQSSVQVWNNAERILLFVQWHRLPGILPDAGHSRLEELPLLCQTHLQVWISSCCVHFC